MHLPFVDFCKLEYAILCNREVEFIEKFSNQHPTTFVLPFITSMDQMKDYNKLGEGSDDHGNHIAMPMFVGNLVPLRKAIHEYVRIFLQEFNEEKVCIYDESEAYQD